MTAPARIRSALLRVLSGSALGQGALLAASPLLARLYDEEAFGVLALVTSTSAVLGAVASGGWERAVVSTRSETVARALVALGVATSLVVGVLAAVPAGLLAGRLADVLGTPPLAGLWWLLPLTSTAIGVQRTVAVALVRRSAFGSLGRRNAVQGLAQVGVALVLAPTGGPLGLALGPAVARALGSLGTLVGRPGRRRRGVPVRVLLAVAGRSWRRAAASCASSLVNVVGLQAPVVLLSTAFGATTVGLVALATRLVVSPAVVVAEAVGHVVDARLGGTVRAGRARAAHQVTRSVLAGTAVAAPGAAALWALAPVVVPLLAGDGWHGLVDVVRWVVVSGAAQAVALPVSRTLVLLHRPGAQLAWDVVRFVATSGALLVTAAVTHDPLATVAAWSLSTAACYLALVGTSIAAARSWDSGRPG
ncbi:lipopolysaccharide biosynthesis protein [Frigoribacterium salinisoli]